MFLGKIGRVEYSSRVRHSKGAENCQLKHPDGIRHLNQFMEIAPWNDQMRSSIQTQFEHFIRLEI